MHGEFDQYIDQYRDNLDKALSLSGESSTFFAQYKADKLREWLPERVYQAQKILDFGCGDGVMTNFVSQYFPNASVYGVDPSAKSVEVAQRSFKHINFSVNSEVEDTLPFEPDTFDIIFAAGAFHHIAFDKHHKYLEELDRIIKPSGCIVLFELNPLNPLTTLTFKRNPIDQYATMLTPWYAHKLAQRYGKATLKFYCFFPKIFKFLRPTERFLTKLPLGALYAVLISRQG